MTQLNTNEQLVVLTAMNKAVSDRLKAVRADADAALFDAYEDMGAEKFALKLNGEKCGELLMTFDKSNVEITNREAFEAWALDYGLAVIKSHLTPAGEKLAIELIEQEVDPDEVEHYIETETVLLGDWEKALCATGNVVTYIDARGPIVPGVTVKGKRPTGRTMVRECKPEVVLPLIQQMPGGVNALLLGGESDE